MLLMFAVLQSAVTPHAPLAIVTQPCAPRVEGSDEIIVCADRDAKDKYRVGPQAPQGSSLPQTRFRLADGVEGSLTAEQGTIGGIPTNRAMISIKIKL